jgi:molybdopterin molybdotransferase
MSLPSVEAARLTMLAGVGPLETQSVSLAAALGRALAVDIEARRDQPPFDASAMDGWAIRRADAEGLAARLRIIGESAAGRALDRPLQAGEAARIFTGAAVPQGADCVVPQEVALRDGDHVRLGPLTDPSSYVRLRGGDFVAGQALLTRGVRLDPWRLALAAAAGFGRVEVVRRPCVAILSTGDEIVPAGEPVGLAQIWNSAGPALAALCETWGAHAVALAPAGDDEEAIAAVAAEAECDLIVTVGGASVGDHDRVKPALKRLGLRLSVEGVNLRPGKPSWFGRLADGRRVLGAPGNPASAMVCAELFLRPLLFALQGLAPARAPATARLASPLPANGPREHWMRAELSDGADGSRWAAPLPDQESSLVTVFAQAEVLLRRPAGASAAATGDVVEISPLHRL